MADVSIVSQLTAGDVTNGGFGERAWLATEHLAELGKKGPQVWHALTFFITEAIASKSKSAHLALLHSCWPYVCGWVT